MFMLVGIAVLAFYFAVLYKSQSFTETKYIWSKTPSIAAVLLKILVRIIRRRQGKVYHGDVTNRAKQDERTDGDGVVHLKPSPDEVVIINGYRVTQELVAQYKAVCSDEEDDKKETKNSSSGAVPLCFPDCLFMYNFLLLVCKPSFKLSPLGLIHVGQSIKKHGDLRQLLEGPCSIEARTTAYRAVSRGIEVDITVRVIAASDLCVWSGVATLLSRSQLVQSGSGSSSGPQQTVDSDWEMQDKVRSQQMEAAADTGVRYAGVSGDWNPHHLYPWTARLLGYRAPIAHGLWTLAKAVDLLSESADDPSGFTEVECRFKRPLFLPGTAVLQHYADGNIVKFRVVDSRTQVPHLVGTLR